MPGKKMRAASPDGKYGLSWGSDGIVGIIDMRSGDTLLWLEDNHPVWILRAVFSRDMQRILCYNWGGTVGVWSVPPGLRGRRHYENIVEAAYQQRDLFVLRRAHLRL